MKKTVKTVLTIAVLLLMFTSCQQRYIFLPYPDYDGAPVIDTFSSFLTLPSLYAYRTADGRYGFGSERFDIMRL